MRRKLRPILGKSQYLSQGTVEEDAGISPGRMTFKATASVGYLLEKKP
jgi:hypothetical protein